MNKEDLKNNRAIRHIYYFSSGIVFRARLKRMATKALTEFKISFEKAEDKAKYVNDMVNTYMYHGFTFDEYICLNLSGKSHKEKHEFVADWEHLGYACALNNHKNDEIFDNKWKTYEKFKAFYGREVMLVDNGTKNESFLEFVSRHKTFVIKPLDLSCGRGVKVIDAEKTDITELWISKTLRANNGRFIAEELIIQSKELAEIHPSSVNTVRVPAIRMEEEVIILNPFFRVGQNGNFVDNAGAGGIICAVDTKSGVVTSAADEHGNTFKCHPQTDKEMVGYKIPRWEEAKTLVAELAKVVPDNRYTGWDIALTDKGWILVEANRRGQFVWQISTQVGFRREINNLLKKLGKKY